MDTKMDMGMKIETVTDMQHDHECEHEQGHEHKHEHDIVYKVHGYVHLQAASVL
jgi:hypothetical protein